MELSSVWRSLRDGEAWSVYEVASMPDKDSTSVRSLWEEQDDVGENGRESLRVTVSFTRSREVAAVAAVAVVAVTMGSGSG